MIILIDNYDSFVYNLARYFRELGCATQVIRNDAATVAQIERMAPEAVVISPGPCTPAEAGISVELVRSLPAIPMLGVCLGHQAIGAALGAAVVRAPAPVHGMADWIHHRSTRLFQGISNPFRAGRYHSLCVADASLPPQLQVTARTSDGTVMAVEHEARPLRGVQFHPESILTESGHRLLANFLAIAGVPVSSTCAAEWIRAADRPDALENAAVAGMPIHW